MVLKLASFPGLPRLQFLIVCSEQGLIQSCTFCTCEEKDPGCTVTVSTDEN